MDAWHIAEIITATPYHQPMHFHFVGLAVSVTIPLILIGIAVGVVIYIVVKKQNSQKSGMCSYIYILFVVQNSISETCLYQ